ncbi:MAG: hypothetical protein COB50_00005, partial [Thiotrichales bacterium]
MQNNTANLVHTAGYKFVKIINTKWLRLFLYEQCEAWQLRGSIILSDEGINFMLAGTRHNIDNFYNFLKQDQRFTNLTTKESTNPSLPFDKMVIKVKGHLVPTKNPIKAITKQSSKISATQLQDWLDNNEEFNLLDTRNIYEVEKGGFKKAHDLKIRNFSEITEKLEKSNLDRNKPLVMFCTGGIRCEKALPIAKQLGFE